MGGEAPRRCGRQRRAPAFRPKGMRATVALAMQVSACKLRFLLASDVESFRNFMICTLIMAMSLLNRFRVHSPIFIL